MTTPPSQRRSTERKKYRKVCADPRRRSDGGHENMLVCRRNTVDFG